MQRFPKKDVTPLEDSQIIALFWAREEEAIAQTHAAYGRKLFCLSERILGSRQDAEERVNDTYLKVWNLIPPQKPRFFYAFLASICRLCQSEVKITYMSQLSKA